MVYSITSYILGISNTTWIELIDIVGMDCRGSEMLQSLGGASANAGMISSRTPHGFVN